MSDFYTLEVAGLKRDLPVCPLNDHVSIAGFVMFGDVELTIKAAELLIKKIPEVDVIVTPESKGIPLAYEMARQLGIRYIVVRKTFKLYMQEPFTIDVKSITTEKLQKLYLDGSEAAFLTGKKVLIVDDVISTGESLSAVEKLVKKAGGNIAAKCAVLAEGDAAERDDIIFLQELPLIFKDKN